MPDQSAITDSTGLPVGCDTSASHQVLSGLTHTHARDSSKSASYRQGPKRVIGTVAGGHTLVHPNMLALVSRIKGQNVTRPSPPGALESLGSPWALTPIPR